MRHQVAGRKLGRTTAHRWALFRNQVASLVEKERIETTLHKAKELRPIAEHLITIGKRDTVAARRQAFYYLRDKALVSKLFAELAPRFASRQGGYTRILKTGFRLGDSAAVALIEYLDRKLPELVTPKKGKKSAAKKEVAPKDAEAKKVAKEAKKAKKEVAPKAEKEPKAKKAAPKKKEEAAKKEVKAKKTTKKA